MRLPIYYGWVIVAVVFVSMGVGVNARTAFSLLFPPILAEFGWERGVTAGAFSFGFLVSAALSPSLGRLMDRRGPRVVIELGVLLIGAGLLLATVVTRPWHLYATLGVMVGGGSVCLGYTGQSLFLPDWFVRRRGLAMSLAFSGVGVGSMILLPWMQTLIGRSGWRAACWAMGLLVLLLLVPLNLLLRRRPQDMGLEPDGDRAAVPGAVARPSNVVDAAWAAVDWTLAPRDAHRPVLVDRHRLLHRALRVVRGAGAPDQVPDRDRLQPDRRGVGARLREPGRHPRPDRARLALGPDRARVGVDRGRASASRSATRRCSCWRSPRPRRCST